MAELAASLVRIATLGVQNDHSSVRVWRGCSSFKQKNRSHRPGIYSYVHKVLGILVERIDTLNHRNPALLRSLG